MDKEIKKGAEVSIQMRSGEVVFGKYDRPARNGYHYIDLNDGGRIDRKLDKIKFLNSEDINFANTQIDSNEKRPALTPPKAFSINQKFQFLENMIRMVIKKVAVSMIITGEGGVGQNAFGKAGTS